MRQYFKSLVKVLLTHILVWVYLSGRCQVASTNKLWMSERRAEHGLEKRLCISKSF